MKRIYILLFLVFAISCEEKTPENQPPECNIKIPDDNENFQFRDTISIIIEATDPDGLINEIQLYFGETGITSLKDFPYTYSLETGDYTPGEYAIKATAIDNEGLESSDVIQIMISSLIPTITTDTVTDITVASAISGGMVKDDGGSEITAKGLCWSISPEPTLEDNFTTDGSGNESFSSSISGLDSETTYFVRAYGTNSAGTAYGNVRSFETRVTVTDYDGNVYQTVKIGDQLWMAENLKVTHYADGTAIPYVESSSDWLALQDPVAAYCWINNDISNRDIYGSLYTWGAAVNGEGVDIDASEGVQGVCPAGWHMPSNLEWAELINYLGGEDIAGGKMKDTESWDSPNTGATNESGFTALACSYRDDIGGFARIGKHCMLWSASYSFYEPDQDHHQYRNYLWLNYDNSRARDNRTDRLSARSVRCVRD